MARYSKPYLMTGEPVRCRYPAIFEPKKNKFDPTKKARYELRVLIPKDHPEFPKLVKAVKEAAEECRVDISVMRSNPVKNCKASDERRAIDGYAPRWDFLDNPEDHYFFTAWSESPPGVVNTDNEDLIDKGSARDGCEVKLSLNIFDWEVEGKRGLSFGLEHVMICGEGEPFPGAGQPRRDQSPWKVPGGDLSADLKHKANPFD